MAVCFGWPVSSGWLASEKQVWSDCRVNWPICGRIISPAVCVVVYFLHVSQEGGWYDPLWTLECLPRVQ